MPRKLIVVSLLALLTLSLSCGDEKGQVILSIISLTAVSQPFGDILDDEGTIPTDSVDIILHNDVKNPDFFGSLTYADIILDSITVSFTRTDGGSATPETFRSAVSYTVPARGQILISGFPIVPGTLKTKFPVSDLLFYGYERSTNFISIRCDIKIEISGRTVEGDPVFTEGGIAIEFTNWAG